MTVRSGNIGKVSAVKKTRNSKKTPNKNGVTGANKHVQKEIELESKIRAEVAKKKKKNKLRKKQRTSDSDTNLSTD